MAGVYHLIISHIKVMTAEMPYDDAKTTFELIRRITGREVPRVDKHHAFGKLPAPRKLLNRCWVQEPDDRPKMSEIVKEMKEITKAAT